MNIKVNGKDQVLDKGEITVLELLGLNNVEMPDMVSVQVNGEFVQKEEYEKKNLKDNDEVDFLYFMGGGLIQTEAESTVQSKIENRQLMV